MINAADLASLGIKIERTEVDQATGSLYKFTKAAQGAEVATTRLATATRPALGSVAGDMVRVERAALTLPTRFRAAERAMMALSLSGLGLTGQLGRLGTALTLLGRGSPWIIGTVVAAGLVGMAYRELTEDTRKLREEQEKLAKATKDALGRQAEFGRMLGLVMGGGDPRFGTLSLMSMMPGGRPGPFRISEQWERLQKENAEWKETLKWLGEITAEARRTQHALREIETAAKVARASLMAMLEGAQLRYPGQAAGGVFHGPESFLQPRSRGSRDPREWADAMRAYMEALRNRNPDPAGLMGLVGTQVPGVGGMVAGGIPGFINEIIGAGVAAHRAAEQMNRLREALGRTLETIQSEISGDTLAVAIAQEKERFNQLRQQTQELYRGIANAHIRRAVMEEIDRLEAERIQQLKDEAEALKQVEDVRRRGDYEVRGLRARGLDDFAANRAFEIEQELELAELRRQGATETELAALQELHLLEARRREQVIFEQLIQTELSARQGQLDAAQQALGITTRTVDVLRAYAGQLRIGSASPWASVGIAREQFDTLAARARAGDQDAAMQLAQSGQQFLDLSRQYNASGLGYQNDVAYVLGIIDQLGDQYEVQKNLEQIQVDELKKIVELLQRGPSWQEYLRIIGESWFPPVPGDIGGPPSGSGSGSGALATLHQAGYKGIIGELEQLRAEARETGTKTARAIEALKLVV